MTELNETELKLKSTLMKAVPNEMMGACKEILSADPNNQDALYVKGLAECILGDFRECTITWSKIDRINPNIYNRDDFADAVTRKFVRSFVTCLEGTGLGMYECTKIVLDKADEDIGLYRAVFKKLDNRVFPNRIEIFKDGRVMHGNTKYVRCVSDYVLASFDSITDINEQIELLQLCADHIRYVNTDSDIPLFNMVAEMHEYIINELKTNKSKFSVDQLKTIETKRKSEESIVPLLLKARVCQTDRLSLLDVRKLRMPKDAQKNIKKYMDQYFSL